VVTVVSSVVVSLVDSWVELVSCCWVVLFALQDEKQLDISTATESNDITFKIILVLFIFMFLCYKIK
jgi:hypothetical protein